MRWRLLPSLMILVLVSTVSAPAADLKIDDPRWTELSRDEQQKILMQLKEKGALSSDDRIEYIGPKPSSQQKNLSFTQILSIAQALAPLICAAKVAYNKLQCEKSANKDQCIKDAEERGKQASLICVIS